MMESTETLPLRAAAAADGGSLYEARIVYNPCDYLKSYAASSAKDTHEGEYRIQTVEKAQVDRKGNDIRSSRQYFQKLLNFKVSVEKT